MLNETGLQNCFEFIEQAFTEWADEMDMVYQDENVLHVTWLNFDVFYGDAFEFYLNSNKKSLLTTINTFTGEISDRQELYLSTEFIERMKYKLKLRNLQNE